MYSPKAFKIEDEAELYEFIEQWSFADLITTNDGELFVNRVPLVLDRSQKKLYGHLALNNPQCDLLEKAENLMVIFNGVNAYISPSWYVSQEMVPTWNFESVQVKGQAKQLSNDKLLVILEQLTEKHERQFEQPWKLDKVSEPKLNAMMEMIVGFEIDISSIRGKSKLSQNRSVEDIVGVISGLRTQNDKMSLSVAEKMALNLSLSD